MIKTKEIFTINGTSNARECGVFDRIYETMGIKSGFQACSLLVDEDGNLNLIAFYPRSKEEEINKFLNSPLRIYRRELPNGIITTSLRNMVDTDYVHLPHTSPVDLRRISKTSQTVNAFLIDTETDEIKGIRILEFSEKIISQLLEDWISIEDNGYSFSEIANSLNQYVFCHSLKDIQKRSTYVGRENSSMSAKTLYLSSI